MAQRASGPSDRPGAAQCTAPHHREHDELGDHQVHRERAPTGRPRSVALAFRMLQTDDGVVHNPHNPPVEYRVAGQPTSYGTACGRPQAHRSPNQVHADINCMACIADPDPPKRAIYVADTTEVT